jgi:hypothetical protein
MGFEPTIPVFEQAKTFHALDVAATIIGKYSVSNSKSVSAIDGLAIFAEEMSKRMSDPEYSKIYMNSNF